MGAKEQGFYKEDVHWGGVEGWGEKADNCNWVTIKIKKKDIQAKQRNCFIGYNLSGCIIWENLVGCLLLVVLILEVFVGIESGLGFGLLTRLPNIQVISV